jgi:hypothetical protein
VPIAGRLKNAGMENSSNVKNGVLENASKENVSKKGRDVKC